jgi:hypothetical protein
VRWMHVVEAPTFGHMLQNSDFTSKISSTGRTAYHRKFLWEFDFLPTTMDALKMPSVRGIRDLPILPMH